VEKMQTIDAIRRTNELSKVLKQHGFAEDSFQAVNAAKETIGAESDVLDYEQLTEMPSDKVMQKLTNLERSKHLLASRVDSLQQELQTSRDQFKQILSRLDGAEAKLRALRMQPAQAEVPVVAPQHVAEPAPLSPSAEPAPPAAPEKEAHPRQAQMDEKFSIENVFYCGTR
jgi:chromosome segregation ATPase